MSNISLHLNLDDPFDAILASMKRVHDTKRADYTDGDPWGNFRECERGGITMQDGIFTRITDKVTRFYNLWAKAKRGESPAVVDESLDDTLLDLANYAVILLAIRRSHPVSQPSNA